ncbi:MAG: hypothetical protein A2033_04135 [Bacteroidetes bacterium GWA2_31_9]|nr:MAG: hypothetical protein A2033_04135 [Bacteroidetes bacterium GWA2_31_9]
MKIYINFEKKIYMKILSLSFILLVLIIFSCKENSEFKVVEEINCNAEEVNIEKGGFKSDKKFIDSFFTNSKQQTAEFAFSGKYSMKLDKNNQYGFAYTLYNVKANDHYRITVWRMSKSGKGALVISHKDSKLFYEVQKNAKLDNDPKWGQMDLDIIIPSQVDGENLRVYCWNPDTINPVYFDDLKIQYLNKPKEN